MINLKTLVAAMLALGLQSTSDSMDGPLSTHLKAAAGTPVLRFEAATLKPATGGGVRGGCRGVDTKPGADGLIGTIDVPLGRCVVTGARLSHLLAMAYDLKVVARSKNLPDWDTPDFFAVEAKAENPASATQDQLFLMLQSLLADQFKLKVHFETQQQDGYALVVDKNGPKMKKSTTEGGEIITGRPGVNATGGRQNTLICQRVPMTSLALRLTNQSGLSAAIVDKTGLTGAYDFELTYEATNRDMPAGQPSGASIFTALSEQLGLKLVAQKTPFEYLIVDHAEKP